MLQYDNSIKRFVRYLACVAWLTPMHKVLRHLRGHGLDPSVMSAVEVFGCDGEHHTRELISGVKHLDIWEYAPNYEAILRSRFPDAEVKIVDSYEEIKATSKKYDLVVVDNADSSPGHYEHFDLFPDVFRVLNESAVLVVNAMPMSPSMLPEHLKSRQDFYRVSDARHVSINDMIQTYQRWAEANGWHLGWHVLVRRWTFRDLVGWIVPTDVPLYYAVLYLEKRDGEQ